MDGAAFVASLCPILKAQPRPCGAGGSGKRVRFGENVMHGYCSSDLRHIRAQSAATRQLGKRETPAFNADEFWRRDKLRSLDFGPEVKRG